MNINLPCQTTKLKQKVTYLKTFNELNFISLSQVTRYEFLTLKFTASCLTTKPHKDREKAALADSR